MLNDKTPVIALAGGTDCSGGAGLPADISVVRFFNAYPMPIVTCVTSQGPDGLRMMQPVDADLFADQLSAVFDNVRPDAFKIGMLPSAWHMEAITHVLEKYQIENVVFDPVMAPTDGAGNFKADWWRDNRLLAGFLGHVDMITPNLVELKRLTAPIADSSGDEEKAELDSSHGEQLSILLGRLFLKHYDCRSLLITGGHNEENQFCDILMHNDACCRTGSSSTIRRYQGMEVETPNTHGTGCVYSSAIATLLGRGMADSDAVDEAKLLIRFLLEEGKNLRLYNRNPQLHDGSHGPTFARYGSESFSQNNLSK